MALGAVSARFQGDSQQGMYFWFRAANLLRPGTNVVRVDFEHDEAGGVDDIAVFYEPACRKGGRDISADFIQCKFHVDLRDTYDSMKVCDAGFIGRKVSILQRFHEAYRKLRPEHAGLRLALVSNWRWDEADPLAGKFLELEAGALPTAFFDAGTKSRLGGVRATWQSHLGLDDDEFRDFVGCLRFEVGFYAKPRFIELLNGTLCRAGLVEIPDNRSHDPFSSLYGSLVEHRHNSFDEATFRDLCTKEGLVRAGVPSATIIGIRSFLDARNMADETDRFVCVAESFDHRHVRAQGDWADKIKPAVLDFLADPTVRTREHHLLLDCHASLAFLAGHALHRKSGAAVFPIQKGAGAMQVWKPKGLAPTGDLWTCEQHGDSDGDLVVAMSVTRDVSAAVTDFTSSAGIAPARRIDVRPSSGLGGVSVNDADHAFNLADQLSELVRRHRPKGGTVHLLAAAPNALIFFLGQQRGALGTVQLYEFDFEESRHGSYITSLRLEP